MATPHPTLATSSSNTEVIVMRAPTRRALRLLPVAFCSLLALALPAGEVSAQTAFIPYFGKNQIRYDKFRWHIYTTDHFEIYYYPEIEQHLERMAGYAESAYQHVSSELKHDLGFKVPLMLFKTQPSSSSRTSRRGGARRRRRVRRAEPRSHRAADGRAARPALSADHARADPRVRVRHHPARRWSAAACRCGSTKAWPTTWPASGAARSDDRARRRSRRHRAEDDASSRATAASAIRA